MRDAVRLTVGTLTAVPTPPPARIDRSTAGAAMLLAPLTAVPPALVAVVVHLVVASGAMPASVGAVLVLGLVGLWSRGLHLDGLADTVDGLASGVDRQRALEVMRRSDVGPSGVAALVLALLLQFAAISSLLGSRGGAALLVVGLLASRYALAWGCWRRVPAARHTGLGATVSGSVPDPALAATSSIMLGAAAGVSVLGHTAWYAGALVVVAATLGAGGVLAVSTRRLGGVTGDVLGACVEVALATGLLVATVLL